MDALKIALYADAVVLAGAVTRYLQAWLQKLTRKLEDRNGVGA